MALTLVGPLSWQAAAIAASSNFVQVNFPAADGEEEHFQGEGKGGSVLPWKSRKDFFCVINWLGGAGVSLVMFGEVSPQSDSLIGLCSEMAMSLEMGRLSEFSSGVGELNFGGDEGLCCRRSQILLVLVIVDLPQFVSLYFAKMSGGLKLDQKTSRKLVEALYSQVHALPTNRGEDSFLF